jgi:hypothetical protein
MAWPLRSLNFRPVLESIEKKMGNALVLNTSAL